MRNDPVRNSLNTLGSRYRMLTGIYLVSTEMSEGTVSNGHVPNVLVLSREDVSCLSKPIRYSSSQRVFPHVTNDAHMTFGDKDYHLMAFYLKIYIYIIVLILYPFHMAVNKTYVNHKCSFHPLFCVHIQEPI